MDQLYCQMEHIPGKVEEGSDPATSPQSSALKAAIEAADLKSIDLRRDDEYQGRNTIVIIGVPRSGTTWLGKIFDSHPDVLYRHEPDTVLRRTGIPGWVLRSEVPFHREAARDYLRRLIGVRTLKSAGSLPVFRKSFHGAFVHLVRSLIIHSLRSARALPFLGRMVRRVSIPDFSRLGKTNPDYLVVKSVGVCGRARLVADTVVNGHLVLVLRNPCGHVASMMRGYALKKFENPFVIDDLLQTEQAIRHGLTTSRLSAMTEAERIAWRWVLLNEKALSDLEDVSNAWVITYEALAADPIGMARKLFAFVGLGWHAQTEAFIHRSTTYRRPGKYFQVFQDTPTVVNKWRTELAHEDIVRIAGIVRSSPLRSFFPELHEFVIDLEYAVA